MDIVDALKRTEGSTLELKGDQLMPEGVLRTLVVFTYLKGLMYGG